MDLRERIDKTPGNHFQKFPKRPRPSSLHHPHRVSKTLPAARPRINLPPRETIAPARLDTHSLLLVVVVLGLSRRVRKFRVNRERSGNPSYRTFPSG